VIGFNSFGITQAANPDPTAVITSIRVAGGGYDFAPNSWVEIRGTNLVPSNIPAEGVIWNTAPEFNSGRMPTQLGGYPVSVTINNKAAFVYYFCKGGSSAACPEDQINVLTPLDGSIGPSQIVVKNGSITTAPSTMRMVSASPSFPLLERHFVRRSDASRRDACRTHFFFSAWISVLSGETRGNHYPLWIRIRTASRESGQRIVHAIVEPSHAARDQRGGCTCPSGFRRSDQPGPLPVQHCDSRDGQDGRESTALSICRFSKPHWRFNRDPVVAREHCRDLALTVNSHYR